MRLLKETGKWVFALCLAALVLLVVVAIAAQLQAMVSDLFHSTWIRVGLGLMLVATVLAAITDRGAASR